MKTNKLVRDNIPELIKKSGKEAKWVSVVKEQRIPALVDKLREEVDELIEASTSKDANEFLEEAADVYEVLLALVYQHGFIDADLDLKTKRKRHEKGAFDKFIWLKSVETND